MKYFTILILLLFFLIGNAQPVKVPDTNTFSLQDVVDVVGGDDLQEAFALSVDAYFDPAYKGDKTNLYNFRNYTPYTGDPTLPVIATTLPYSVTTTSAWSGGEDISDGGSPITTKGICYVLATSSSSVTPTISNMIVSGGSGTATFTAQMTSLLPGRQYYIRAYATNSVGTAYGSLKSIVTGFSGELQLQYTATRESNAAKYIGSVVTTSPDVYVVSGNYYVMEFDILNEITVGYNLSISPVFPTSGIGIDFTYDIKHGNMKSSDPANLVTINHYEYDFDLSGTYTTALYTVLKEYDIGDLILNAVPDLPTTYLDGTTATDASIFPNSTKFYCYFKATGYPYYASLSKQIDFVFNDSSNATFTGYSTIGVHFPLTSFTAWSQPKIWPNPIVRGNSFSTLNIGATDKIELISTGTGVVVQSWTVTPYTTPTLGVSGSIAASTYILKFWSGTDEIYTFYVVVL